MKEPAGPYDAIVWRKVPGVGYVAGPDARIQRNGFSLLPPSGRGWMVAPTGKYGAGWGKLLSDSKGNRPLTPKTIDLSETPFLYITGPVSESAK